jgi:adenylate kinase
VLRALLLAPPGAGKGTQGEQLGAIYRVPHLSTGELLRDHVARGTPIGLEAAAHVDRGDLVPDRLVLELVAARIDGDDPLPGFVLDGFPRTLAQAKTAYAWGREHGRTFHVVLSMDVPEDELVRRLIERGHVSSRADDTEDTIRHRLAVYRENTRPLLDFYADRSVLVEVDGTGSVDDVTDRLRAAIDPVLSVD